MQFPEPDRLVLAREPNRHLAFAAGIHTSAGAALAPLTLLLLIVAGAVVLTALLRIDLALLLVVATAPLEAAFASGPAGISVTKLAGGLCFAAFAATLVRSRRRLLVDPTYAIVLGILGLAALSATQAGEVGTAISTTVRYGSFAIVYIIVSEFGGDALLQRRIAWVLAATSAPIAGADRPRASAGPRSKQANLGLQAGIALAGVLLGLAATRRRQTTRRTVV